MTPQTVTIEVDPQTAATLVRLQAQAAAADTTLAALLQPLVANGAHTPPVENGSVASQPERPLYETATPAELAQAFLDWAYSHDPNTPGLTLEDLSRESIYGDRC